MADYDAWVPVSGLPTDCVAIRPAATVVLVDDRPDLQVLVLKRRDASVFVGGHTVFPGGVVAFYRSHLGGGGRGVAGL